jgi:hypothetical protein
MVPERNRRVCSMRINRIVMQNDWILSDLFFMSNASCIVSIHKKARCAKRNPECERFCFDGASIV